MANKKKIFYARSRKSDHQISTDEFRTYLDDHILWLSIGFGLTTFLFYFLFKLQGFIFSEALNYRAKLNTWIVLSATIGLFFSVRFVKPVQKLKLKDENSPRLVYDETALEQFNSYEPSPKALQLTPTLALSKRAMETATLITGEPGSGKTVTLDRFHEASIREGSYSIIHDPKGDYTDKYLSCGERVAVLAPWLKQTKAIDFGGMIFNEDRNKQEAILDLFLVSFHGSKPDGDSFWYETSYSVLKAICLKLCKEKQKNWQEIDICQEFYSKQTAEDFHNLKEFYSPIGNLISKEESNMISSIIGSCVPTVVKLNSLANFWATEKSRLNIKDFVYRKTKYQHIIIRNDATYEAIASSVVACFVNVAIAFLLDSEYFSFSKSLKKKEFRFLLDEFNSFAKYLDIPKFNGLSDLGRQAGIRLIICLQRRTQALHFTKNKELANDFLSTFPNLIICRIATDDVKDYDNILGSYKIIEFTSSASFNQQGQSTTEKAQEKEVKNEALVLKNILGPSSTGVKVCIKTVQNPIFAVTEIPFKEFGKELIEEKRQIAEKLGKKFCPSTFKAQPKGNDEAIISPRRNEEKIDPSNIKEAEEVKFSFELEEELIIGDTEQLAANRSFKNEEVRPSEVRPSKEETDPLAELGKEVLASMADPTHLVSLVETTTEVLEALEPPTNNKNTISLEEKLKKIARRQ